MTSVVNKGHIRSSAIYILLNTESFKTFKECQHYEMQYDLKGHPRSYKTTFMPKSLQHIRLWTDFDENLYECSYHADTILHKL